jgi:hypothetical protein
MFVESALRIELHRNGKVVALDIQSDRALIGSGAHCDVRLAPDEAAVEQLLIEALDDDIYARTRAVQPPVFLNGSPFLEGRLPANAVLELGSLFVVAKFAPRQAAEGKKKKGAASTPPVVQALGLAGLAFGFYYVLSQPDGSELAFAGAQVPPPLLTVTGEPCPPVDVTAARSLAREALITAEAKRERSPFYASDGLLAVAAFERAASCDELAGDVAEAEEARRAAAALRARLGDELHVRHVRLERLLHEEKYELAWREAQLASQLVPDTSHPYAQWLSATVREGRIRADSKKETP